MAPSGVFPQISIVSPDFVSPDFVVSPDFPELLCPRNCGTQY
jgi:hypothetical protein